METEAVVHPFKTWRASKKLPSYGSMFSLSQGFVHSLAKRENGCVRLRRESGKSNYHDCHCLSFLAPDEEYYHERCAIARYIIFHFEQSATAKNRTIMDWIRYTEAFEHNNDDNKCRFFLPLIREFDRSKEADQWYKDLNEDHDFSEVLQIRICKASLGRLLDFGYKKWLLLKNSAKASYSIVHGLTGRRGNRSSPFDKFVKDDLHAYFLDMTELASPQSTRFVRETIGSGLRDGADGIVELPPHMSKRQLYARYLYDRGWKGTQTARGAWMRKPRNEEEGSTKPICSWFKFLEYWKTEFPNLVLRAPGEDICNLCHMFHNRWKYLDKINGGEDDEEALANSRREYREALCDFDSNVATFLLEDEPSLPPKQKLLRAAFLHVEMGRVQRKHCNQKIKESVADFTEGKSHEDCRRTIVVDFAQNGMLPHCGASQPGSIYYFCPLNISIFGIVNCSQQGGSLDAFVYTEGEGKKGGNNVASMIMMFLEKQGWIQENVRGKELTIIMDNCAGQNKNNTVLRFAPLLVELGFFSTVNCLFYVVGHTKNACDRWFNTLKRAYRRTDIWTMEKMYEVLQSASEEYTRIHKIKEGDFKDWGSLLDKLYNKIESGKTSTGHLFVSSLSHETPSTLLIRESLLEVAGSHKQEMNPLLTKRKRRPNKKKHEEKTAIRKNVIENYKDNLPTIDAPGIPLSKVIELGTKWRNLCPDEFKDITCPLPSAEDLAEHKKNQKEKREERKIRKQASNNAAGTNQATASCTNTTTEQCAAAPDQDIIALAASAIDPGDRAMELEELVFQDL